MRTGLNEGLNAVYDRIKVRGSSHLQNPPPFTVDENVRRRSYRLHERRFEAIVDWPPAARKYDDSRGRGGPIGWVRGNTFGCMPRCRQYGMRCMGPQILCKCGRRRRCSG